ncbi:MAG: SDR family NAD(P)-dependent oxidoreductase, partial [Solirubrobacterales bacterium]
MAEGSSRIFVPGLLDGEVCVVSGAGTGLGKATALELSGLGATVIGCGRRSEPLQSMIDEVASRGGKAEFEALDIRDDEAVDGFMDGIIERHGRIDLLVNNAGGQFLSPAEAISPKGFKTVIELNVQGTWQMTHAAATKAFIPQKSGMVVSITVSPHMV